MSDLIVGDKDGRGFDWVSVTLGACLGATITFLVGAQNGEQVGKSIERATVQCIDELGVRNSDSTSACWDMQAEALNKMELQRQAIDRLAERCVLSVPLVERLRVTKTRDVKPFKVEIPAPSSSAGSAERGE
jgi:hypothetical protein